MTLALVALMVYGVAQDSKPPKTAKDQAEADLINSIPKTTDPAAKLKILDQWTKAYPQSDFGPERLQEYLATYQALKRPRDAFNTAAEILKSDPNDFQALRSALAVVYELNQPAELDAAEKICNRMLSDLDTIFAPNKMPAGMTDAQWAQVKPAMKVFTQRTIGWIYMTRKDNPRAEAEFIKTLQADPSQAQASYWLATALFAQRTTKPEKQPPSIFEFARAAVYDGPNSLPADFRKQLLASVTKTYASYHGSNDDFDKLLAAAKTNALPPPDFTIKDIASIEREKIEAENAKRAANPMMTIWTDLKAGLTGANPDAFFAEHVKDAALPKFKGAIVDMKPALRPKVLTVSVEKAGVADCTLKLDEGQTLPGKMDPGGEIEFEGVGESYTKDPYMLTLTVDKAKISGWKGTNPPAGTKKTAKKAAK